MSSLLCYLKNTSTDFEDDPLPFGYLLLLPYYLTDWTLEPVVQETFVSLYVTQQKPDRVSRMGCSLLGTDHKVPKTKR